MFIDTPARKLHFIGYYMSIKGIRYVSSKQNVDWMLKEKMKKCFISQYGEEPLR